MERAGPALLLLWLTLSAGPARAFVRSHVDGNSSLYLYWPHLHHAGTQLPDTAYWARSRHRLSMLASMRQIAGQLRWQCQLDGWPKPADLA